MSYKRIADTEHYLCSMCGEISHINEDGENRLASCAFYEIRRQAFLEAAEIARMWELWGKDYHLPQFEIENRLREKAEE